MRGFAQTLAAVVAVASLGGAPARAQASAPAQIENKLKDYDPATVTAAKAFAKSFNMSGMLEKSAPFLVQGIQFQSTPLGASALKKMPTLSARLSQIMPLMQTYVVPRAMESAQAQMRKNGVDVKI